MDSVRPYDAREYGHEAGFVIEQYRHWNFEDEESWAIPAWDEMGFADLSRVFPTIKAAQAAINSAFGI
jgi:hypothetical protein